MIVVVCVPAAVEQDRSGQDGVGGQQGERRVRRWCICGGACRTIVPDGARGSVMGISSYIANPVQPARRWLQPCTLSSCYLRHHCPSVHLCPVRCLPNYNTPLRPPRCITSPRRPVLGEQIIPSIKFYRASQNETSSPQNAARRHFHARRVRV